MIFPRRTARFRSAVVSSSLHVAVLIALFGAATASARVFLPSARAPQELPKDGATEALFVMTEAAVKAGVVPDEVEGGADGKLEGAWEFRAFQELLPAYKGAARAVQSEDGDRAEMVVKGLDALGAGAFTVDIVLRFDRTGGMFLRLGSGMNRVLVLGVAHRGPGEWELRVPVTDADGTDSVHVVQTTEPYETTGPVEFDRFYRYSLVYDGAGTFEVRVDGQVILEETLPEGTQFALSNTDLAVGDVMKWKSSFSGEIAAVRVSRGALEANPWQAEVGEFSANTKNGWIFDAGSTESPVADGAIPLRPDSLYSSGVGYGWLEGATEDFDEWFVVGKWKTVEQALKENTHKILDALGRDGVVLPEGEFFRVDVPDGRYWVSLSTGHNRGSQNLDDISANGVILGRDLVTRPQQTGGVAESRGVRGVVTVAGGTGISISASGGPVAVQSIEILPFEPLPFRISRGEVEWSGPGEAPAELAGIADALQNDDYTAAVAAAEELGSPWLRACALAWIMGKPKLPEPGDLETAEKLRQSLLETLRAEPENTAARWLFDSSERFRHCLIAYLSPGHGTEIIFGNQIFINLRAADFAMQFEPEDPQYWQAKFMAAAMIWEWAQQNGTLPFVNNIADEFKYMDRNQAIRPPGHLFRDVIEAYPDFRIARMMLGERVPTASEWVAPEGSPEWADLQHELLHRVLEVINYWITERMDESGLMGGGLGDDVEALRWFGTGIFLADSDVVRDGWKRLAETAWAYTKGLGYSPHLSDVEHAAEPTGDSLPMLALLDFDTEQMPETLDRLRRTKATFRDLWTTVTPSGHRMFKSHYFGATEVTEDREGDIPYNIRAINPLLWAVWAAPGGDPELDALMVEYARSWRDAIMSSFDGKPKGVVPMMIYRDRKQARNAGAPDWVYPGFWSEVFSYPRAYAPKVYDLLLAGYEISDDQSFLEPIQSALTAIAKIPDADLDPEKYERGTFDWAIRTGKAMLGVAGANYRLITGDHSFDDVLVRIGPPLIRFQIQAERAKNAAEFAAALEPVIAELKVGLEEMNTNYETRTVVAKSTDRIYVKGTIILNAMATGLEMGAVDVRGEEIVWPAFIVTWQGTESETGVLLRNATPTEIDVMLYNFAEKPLVLKPRVWRLQPGSYQLRVERTSQGGFESEEVLLEKTVTISRPGEEVEFELAPRVPARLRLIKQG